MIIDTYFMIRIKVLEKAVLHLHYVQVLNTQRKIWGGNVLLPSFLSLDEK